MCAFSHQHTRCTQTKNHSTTTSLFQECGARDFCSYLFALSPRYERLEQAINYDDRLWMSRAKTNRMKDREQYTDNIKCGTARPLALLRPAETLERNWLNTNKRQEMVMSTNVLLNTIYRWKIKLTAILWHVTYSTDYYHRLTWESWFANLEQHHWSPQLTVTGTVQNWQRWSNWKLKAIESLLIYPSVKLWQKTAGSKRINHI